VETGNRLLKITASFFFVRDAELKKPKRYLTQLLIILFEKQHDISRVLFKENGSFSKPKTQV